MGPPCRPTPCSHTIFDLQLAGLTSRSTSLSGVDHGLHFSSIGLLEYFLLHWPLSWLPSGVSAAHQVSFFSPPTCIRAGDPSWELVYNYDSDLRLSDASLLVGSITGLTQLRVQRVDARCRHGRVCCSLSAHSHETNHAGHQRLASRVTVDGHRGDRPFLASGFASPCFKTTRRRPRLGPIQSGAPAIRLA